MKKHFLLSFISICVLIISCNSISNYPYLCLQYRSSQCISCPSNTHIYQNQCYNNTIGCLQYQNGDQCLSCNTTYSYLYNYTCVPLVQGTDLQKYLQANSSLGDQYGSTQFLLISIASAQQDRYFQICNNFMLTGEYQHFISKTSDPVVSVHTYDNNNSRQFKILYQGSGGGILLCLIGIDMSTNQIILSSFVVIGLSQLVDLCIDYTTQISCTRCQDGYHLENGICYMNIPSCIRYFKNICLQCKGYSVLVQNRCLADCGPLGDTRSIRFYNNYVTGNVIPAVQRIYYS